MSDIFVPVFITFILGFIFGVLVSDWHYLHVKDYKTCLQLGAPQQNCFDKYLIKKATP